MIRAARSKIAVRTDGDIPVSHTHIYIVNLAPPRPDHTYPGLPDPISAPPAARPVVRRIGRRRNGYGALALPVLAAGLGFGLVAGVIALARPEPPKPAPSVKKTTNILVAKGRGTQTTGVFITGRQWTLRYTFTCTGTGGFTLVEDRATTLVAATKSTGAGDVPRRDDPGSHVIEVRSTCSWTLTAIG
jgi:hypothetical protein